MKEIKNVCEYSAYVRQFSFPLRYSICVYDIQKYSSHPEKKSVMCNVTFFKHILSYIIVLLTKAFNFEVVQYNNEEEDIQAGAK